MSSGTSSLIKGDQLSDKTPDRLDNETLASLLTELPRSLSKYETIEEMYNFFSLESNETLESVNDPSVTSLQSPVTTDTICK